MEPRRKRILEIASELQNSISPEALNIKKMVGLLFEEAKHKLVSAEGDDLLRLQGEARALDKLYKELTVASASALRDR
jgi:hypothetical protein